MSAQEEQVNRKGGGFSPDLVYSRDDLMWLTGLGQPTFDEMEEKDGLERIQPTTKVFFHGGDVFQAMREMTRRKKQG